MPKDISLSQLRAERRALAARLALLDRAIFAFEALKSENGHSAPPKRSHHKKVAAAARPAPPTSNNGSSTGPTLREAVTQIVVAEPGILPREVVRRLVGRVALTSSDPRKLISTRVGQFVKAGKFIRDDEGGLHLPA
jgi:hypothetical protein